MHVGKTECILFGSKRNLSKIKEFKIEYNGCTIKGQSTVKYLGVILDQTLSGDHMAKSVISKITKKLKFLYRYQQCLNQTIKRNLCSALLQCHFDYCCSSWYFNLNTGLKRKLQTTQNKIARYVIGLPPRSHIGQNELDSIKYLNVEDRVKQLCLNHVFKVKTGSSPVYLKGMFTDVSQIHKFNTRNSNHNFNVPSVKGVASNSFFFQSAKLWNHLPNQIKCTKSYVSFKRRIKIHLSKSSHLKQASDFVYA